MSLKKHSIATNNHRPITWVFTNSAARASATNPITGTAYVTTDLYKDCIQLDTGARYTLTAIIPTWQWAGIANGSANQVLSMDGLGQNVVWAPTPGGTGIAGINLFPDDTIKTNTGTENDILIETLEKVPFSAPEEADNIVVTGNTSPVVYGTYLRSSAFGATSFPAGTWTLNLYRSVSTATGVTSLSLNVMRVVYNAETVTVTGTGTSRTATASGGTPFATSIITASATKDNASYLRTPKGLYQITGRTGDTVITITTPTGYINESAVTMATHNKLFQFTTGEINDTTVTLQTITSVQSAFTVFPTDSIALMVWGVTDGTTASRTVTFYHDGMAHYSYLTTPLASAVATTAPVTFLVPGNAYVADNIVWGRMPWAMTLSLVRAGLITAGTGTGSTKFKIMYHATDPASAATIFTSETNAPALAAAAVTADSGTPSTTTLAADGFIGIGYSAVCATTPGTYGIVKLVPA